MPLWYFTVAFASAVLMLAAPEFWVVLSISFGIAFLVRKFWPTRTDPPVNGMIDFFLPFLCPVSMVLFAAWQRGATAGRASTFSWHAIVVYGLVLAQTAITVLVVRRARKHLWLRVATAALGEWFLAGAWLLTSMSLSDTWL